MGTNETAVVFFHDQDTPGPIKERLLEHGGPRALAAEYEDASPAIPRDTKDGAGQPFRNGERSTPKQRLIVPVKSADR